MAKTPAKKAPKRKVIARPVHFETTIPVLRPCKRCRVWLWAGVAEGMHVEVELVMLDPTQAFMATITGVRLYALMRSGLVLMDDSRMTDPRWKSYFPEHRCGTIWESRVEGAGDTRPTLANSQIPPY